MSEILIEDRFTDAITTPGTWQTVRIADVFSSSDLEDIRRVLSQARAILDAFDSVLGVAEAFVSILRALESFINDVLLAALLALTDALQNAVDEFKTTGVYALDLVTPFLIGNVENIGDECDALSENFIPSNSSNPLKAAEDAALKYFNQASRSFYKKQTYEMFIEEIIDAFLDENDLPSPYITQKRIESLEKAKIDKSFLKRSTGINETKAQQDSLLNTVFKPGRPNFGPQGKLKFYLITISVFDFLQFINIFIAFSRFFGNIIGNHGASIELFQRASAYYICLKRYFIGQTFDSLAQQEASYNQDISEANGEIGNFEAIDMYFSPKLSTIGNQSLVSNYITFYNDSISFLEGFIATGNLDLNYTLIVRDIANLCREISELGTGNANIQTNINNRILDIQTLRNSYNQNNIKIQKAESNKTLINSQRQTFIADTRNDNNIYVKAICGNDDGSINDDEVYKRKKFSAVRGKIDFYGMSAYQLFPDLFELIDELLNKIRSYAKPIATGISDMLDNIIRAIREEIENLRQIINVIERILQFIEDFLNLNGISMLAIDTDAGNYGLISQLRQAQGFPGQNTGKEMYIAGFMVGIGYPNVGSDGIFSDVGLAFELQKNNIDTGSQNLEQLIGASKNNAESAINKFAQFFK